MIQPQEWPVSAALYTTPGEATSLRGLVDPTAGYRGGTTNASHSKLASRAMPEIFSGIF